MIARLRTYAVDLLGPGPVEGSGYLWARWLFLRCLGLIFFSAFYSLLFQADGLIGPSGILPARDFLTYVAQQVHGVRYFYVPSLFWMASGSAALKAACWAGLLASGLLTLNLWPRAMTAACTLLYLSFISTLQVFASYQSDGMLLEAGLLSLFLAPGGIRPGLAEDAPPSRASRFLLLFLCFRIYFESGIAKILSGDPHWRHFTAMDDYYQNGPLPTWVGWYVQQLPHSFHAFCTAWALAAELILVWLFFAPNRRVRIGCFWVLGIFQIGIMLTSNYAFINHITIALSLLLLDDVHVEGLWKRLHIPTLRKDILAVPPAGPARLILSGLFLGWLFYANSGLLVQMLLPTLPLPMTPVELLEPFRFANRFGLFAVMTPARYEIEFQGTHDGKNWVSYPFRYKPQALDEVPRVYSPYQPRFDWNLWFASLGDWQRDVWVVRVEQQLLQNEPAVLGLFRSNPFKDNPPTSVRTLFWQYWFTDLSTRRRDHLWWRRRQIGLYAPTLAKRPDGKIVVLEQPGAFGFRGD